MPAVAATQEVDESALDAIDDKASPAPVKTEPAGAAELRDAIRRIAVRPSDSYALADAGYASLKLGDADAAYNFFARANALQPSDPRIKSGLASAMVHRENPFEALRLFDEAKRLGANERSFALDRAIAFDLLGNFERAQQDYQNARLYAPGDELTRRHAVSLSLMGKNADADALLYPLLQRDDPESWRLRTFILAARGDFAGAEKIASSFLSPTEARKLDYYLRQMPRLTPAQQAAALHFGHFPTGGNIGQDSEQLRIAAAATGLKPRPATGDGRLIPSGEPFGTKTANGRDGKKQRDRKPSKADIQTAKRDGRGTVATASAQAAIDRAAVAAPRVLQNTQLPAPEAARPLVRIVLPARQASPAIPAASVSVASNTPSSSGTSAAGALPVKMENVTASAIRPTAIPASDQPAANVGSAQVASRPLAASTQTVTTQAPSPRPAAAELPAIGPAVLPIAGESKPPATANAPVIANTPAIDTAPKPPIVAVKTPEPVIVKPELDSPTVGPATAATPVAATQVETAPAAVTAAIQSPKAESPSVPLPASDVQAVPAVAATAATIKPAAAPEPGFAAMDAPVAIAPAETSLKTVPPAPSMPAAQQGPTLDGTVVTPNNVAREAPPAATMASIPAAAAQQPGEPMAVLERKADIASAQDDTPPPAVAPTEGAPIDLGSVIDAIDIPDAEKVRSVAPVDLKSIKSDTSKAKEGAKAAVPEKNAKASNPARTWVQIATGAEGPGLGFEYRRWAKKVPNLFASVGGYSAAWSKSRRLLVGPFADVKTAKKWEADFRKAGGDGFIWQSEAGLVVEPLKSK
jgi:Flp pilus assembly protein TadD